MEWTAKVSITLEVIAVTIDDAIAAERGGADRIELIANFLEGGTTASAGVIRSVKKAVSIPVYAMIRPHGGGFVYSELEIDAMIEDARLAREAGADGIVVGTLRPDGKLDVEGLKRVIEAAQLPVTFHRAFDTLPEDEMLSVLDELKEIAGIERVLTSGGKENPYEGRQVIAKLVDHGGLSIMAGGGIVPGNLAELVRVTGLKDIHVGTAARKANDPTAPVSEANVRRIREILS